MSATGQVPSRGRRHTIATKTQAIRYAEAGWTDAWIGRELGVSKATVGTWTKPQREQRAREALQRHHALRSEARGRKPLGYPFARPEFKLARMRALRALPMTCRSIAHVMAFDFGDHWLTERNVRHALETGRYPKEKTA